MFFESYHLLSPSGHSLEIKRETHVYTEENYKEGIESLQGVESLGVEGVVGLSKPEKFGLLLMYYVSLPFISLFAGSKHSSENPTITQTASCYAIKHGLPQPKDPVEYQENVCEPLFGSNVPEIPSLKKVSRLEGNLSPSEQSSLLFLEMRFIPLVFAEIMGIGAILLRPKQAAVFIIGRARQVGRFILRRSPIVVKKFEGPRFWVWTEKWIGDPAAKAFNPFAWPRYFFEHRLGQPLSLRAQSQFDHLEAGVFYFWIYNRLITSRNSKMARYTNAMVEGEGAYRNNMIIVGALHYGIADVLVSDYGYTIVEKANFSETEVGGVE
jgi:hypothetical protein